MAISVEEIHRHGESQIAITIDLEGAEWLADEMHSVWLHTNDSAAKDIYDAIYEILDARHGENDG